MTEWTRFLDQLPLLLVCIPFCGILTIGLVNLIGREHLPRTFLLNGVLSLTCALVILFQFEFGSERTGLAPAESFQSVIVLTDSAFSAGFQFGVDGCSLLLIVVVSALPLLVYRVWNPAETEDQLTVSHLASGLTTGRAALVLLLQALLLVFLLALDWRVQLVALLLSTVVLFVELAVSLPSNRRRLLNGWHRQLLLSDFLIAGGLLAAITPLIRHTGIGTDPGQLFNLVRILETTELMREMELTRYVRLMSAVTPSTALILVGCSIRFGMFPFSQAARTMWEQTAPWQRLLIWAHGPVLGSAMMLRELQIFPLAAYQVIGLLKYLWLFGLFVSAIFVRLSTGSRREAGQLIYLCSLLFLSTGGPNTVSLAGSVLLLISLGCRLSVSRYASPRVSARQFALPASMFLMTAGTICILIGFWQGLGADSRGVGTALAIGLSLLIAGYTRREAPTAARRNHPRLFPNASRSPASDNSEQPIWEIPESSIPDTMESRRLTAFRAAGLILAICLLLLLPDFLWQRIRGDLQKIEFPQGEFGLTAREEQP